MYVQANHALLLEDVPPQLLRQLLQINVEKNLDVLHEGEAFVGVEVQSEEQLHSILGQFCTAEEEMQRFEDDLLKEFSSNRSPLFSPGGRRRSRSLRRKISQVNSSCGAVTDGSAEGSTANGDPDATGDDGSSRVSLARGHPFHCPGTTS